MNTLLQQRKHQLQKCNKEGNSWIAGCYMIVFVFAMMLIILTKYRVTLFTEFSEDAVKDSVLASLIPDYRQYSITGNLILDRTPLEAFDLFLEVFEDNVGLEQDSTDKFLFTNASGTNPYFEKAVVKEATFYNMYTQGTGQTEVIGGITHQKRKLVGVKITRDIPTGSTIQSGYLSHDQVYKDAATNSSITATAVSVTVEYTVHVLGGTYTFDRNIVAQLDNASEIIIK